MVKNSLLREAFTLQHQLVRIFFFLRKKYICVCVYISSHIDTCKTFSHTHIHTESQDYWLHNLVALIVRYIVVTVI